MKDINRKMTVGAAWMVLFKFFDRGLGLISTIILARFLVPTDFGLVAMAMSMIAMLELLGAFNFEAALIQNQSSDRRHYDTAWTLNVFFGLVSATILIFLAAPAAAFYKEPRLESVVYLLAVGTFIVAFKNIGVVAFRKEMEFNKEFKFGAARRLTGFFVTVPLAIILRSHWALVIGMLARMMMTVILSYTMHPYRPKFSLGGCKDLFGFSKWLLINNLLGFLKFRSADFIIGRTAGASGLGLFNVSYEISNLPTTELVAPINRAIFPGYAKIASNSAALREGYINVASMVALFALPAAAGISAIAELLVYVFLGKNWEDAVPVIKILAWYGGVIAVQTNIVPVYLAIGKPRILTLMDTMKVFLLLPLVVLFTMRLGAVGAAWAYLAAGLVLLPVNYFIVFKTLGIKLRLFLKSIWRPIVAAPLMYVFVGMFLNTRQFSEPFFGQLASLLYASIVGVICYTAIVFTLWVLAARPQGSESTILRQMASRIRFSANQ